MNALESSLACSVSSGSGMFNDADILIQENKKDVLLVQTMKI